MSRNKESWREMFIEEFNQTGDSFENTVITLTDEELDVKFDSGHGETEGKKFTAWSKDWVYFPICYDGEEWIGRVARNPNGQATSHQGG